MRLFIFKGDVVVQAKLQAHKQRKAVQGDAMRSLANRVRPNETSWGQAK